MTNKEKLQANYNLIEANIDKVLEFLSNGKKEEVLRAEFERLYNLYYDLAGISRTAREPAYRHFLKLKAKERELLEDHIPKYIAYSKKKFKGNTYIMYFRSYLSNKEFLSTYDDSSSIVDPDFIYKGQYGQPERVR
jgi:hypothetical protein